MAFSDIHGLQEMLKVPSGDVLIVAGDLTGHGTVTELQSFSVWIRKQPHAHKICIAGNHDWCFENELSGVSRQLMRDAGVIYLEDSGCEIDGVKFWGSPQTPFFHDWAFNVERGEIKKYWDLIPIDTQVLISHGPPYGILDQVVNRPERLGCQDLLNRVDELDLLAHFFGHIHSGHGEHERTNSRGFVTQFRNVAVLSERYKLVHEPTVLDIL